MAREIKKWNERTQDGDVERKKNEMTANEVE